MTINEIHETAIAPYLGSDYSDLFGIGKSKAQRAESKSARVEKRAAKKVNKEATKGAAERARMGLEDIPVPGTQAAASGKSNILLYAGIGAAAIILVIVIMIFKK
jgi:hypothetical protein